MASSDVGAARGAGAAGWLVRKGLLVPRKTDQPNTAATAMATRSDQGRTGFFCSLGPVDLPGRKPPGRDGILDGRTGLFKTGSLQRLCGPQIGRLSILVSLNLEGSFSLDEWRESNRGFAI
jgi:hypothetical protein